MRAGFYQKLALSGIRKNKKLYLPYIFTCIGMVMMYYIVSFLSTSDTVAAMRGGKDMQGILVLGCGVLAVFAVIFLFYTNSFLIRRRKKEFGLYNILGMGKRHLFRVLFWETLFVALAALAGGLVCGILFSKLAELCMAKILETAGSLTFTVEWGAVAGTALLFAVIFFLILLNGIRQIHLAKPVELLKSEAVGERPPRAKWLSALIGLLLLAGAYYIAVTVENPMATLMMFFVAVVMVILATYLLFISGSVALCLLLQKKKGYYYKTNHFVSVSSMAFRMKRNGAGLASICILSTMVLVMISSTACLYIGKESAIRNRYPRNLEVETYSFEKAYTEPVHEIVNAVLKRHGLSGKNELSYRRLDVDGYIRENEIIFDKSKLADFNINDFDNVRQLFLIPLADYNRIMGAEEVLEPDEALMYCTKTDFSFDTISLEGVGTLRIKEKVQGFISNGVDSMQILPSIFLFLPDTGVIQQIYEVQAQAYGDHQSFFRDYYGVDLDCEEEEAVAIYREIQEEIVKLQIAEEDFPIVNIWSEAQERQSFYSIFGGMFFLGILLGLVFILAAVLMIYYKQISEGYEDQERFFIMQKVGMTKKEIRKSINSQILTVFFLPLLAAGVHTLFAFPIIQKMLILFGLTDVWLFAAVALGCYLLFGLFYVVVYRGTSRAYYRIVSG